MNVWHWPQYVMAAIYLIQIGIHLAKNGEPMEGSYSFATAVITTVIVFVILKAGGFY